MNVSKTVDIRYMESYENNLFSLGTFENVIKYWAININFNIYFNMSVVCEAHCITKTNF